MSCFAGLWLLLMGLFSPVESGTRSGCAAALSGRSEALVVLPVEGGVRPIVRNLAL